MFTLVSDPNEGGRFERVVVRQSKISACPPNQIMDLFILVDTTSDLEFGVQYKARQTIEILMTIVSAYKINLWDSHIAIGVWDGDDINDVVELNDFGDTVLRAGNASTDGSQQV